MRLAIILPAEGSWKRNKIKDFSYNNNDNNNLITSRALYKFTDQQRLTT